MSNVSMPQRIFAFTMAAVFLISACAFSAFVIYDMRQSSKKAATEKAAATPAAAASAGKPLENFTPVESVASLQVTDTKEGDGEAATAESSVTVDYTGAVAATGKIFQSSKDTGQPATFNVSDVIDGWKQGIPGMKVGGVRRLVIPAEMAYGPNPPQGSGIPANAALVFDVTLHSVKPATPPAGAQATPTPEQTPGGTGR
jgi:FKBP-type peptidyl-prolyl cis-trans isomerase